jgi:hypothetical protein
MEKFLDTLFSSKAFKAWTAAAVGLVTAAGSAVADGVIDGVELGAIFGAPFVALGFVYKVKNRGNDSE